MKKITLILFLLISVITNSQISVGPSHVGKPGKFEKGQLEKFKKTKTIFVLSTLYDKSIYEDILKDSWDVTPYEIVSAEDFDLTKYLKDEYSIATLTGKVKFKTTKMGSLVHYVYLHLSVSMYQNDKLLEKLNKINNKNSIKFNNAIEKHEIDFARFELFPTQDFINLATSVNWPTEDYNEKVMNATLNEKVFHNYQPGTLKNYLQKINSLLKDEKIYWMYEDDFLPEIKSLTTKTLYVPDYIKLKTSPDKIKFPLKITFAKNREFPFRDGTRDKEGLEKVFSNYAYNYEIISNEQLSTRILAGEEFYYFRYVRVNSQKFFQIVNSKSGEVIYRNYETGFAYNLKPKHLEALNKTIKKAAK